jgi:hypothetical protein
LPVLSAVEGGGGRVFPFYSLENYLIRFTVLSIWLRKRWKMKNSKIIRAITVKDILDEQIAYKLA